MALHPKLLKKIHVAIRQMNLPDDVYRDILLTQFKAKSSKDLNNNQANVLVKHFVNLGWKPAPAKFDNDRGDIYSATPKQKRLIEILWHSVYRGNSETKHLRQFLFNHFKVSDLRFCDKDKAHMAIEALKKMTRRGRDSAPQNTGAA